MARFSRSLQGAALAMALVGGAGAKAGAGAFQPGEFPPAAEAGEASLTLTFTGLKSDVGAVMIALFDSEASYTAGGAPARVARVAPKGGEASTVIVGLKPGRYAVKAFHDLKGDGKLAFNMFGIPLEPVAFSRNAKVRGQAPSWSETAFDAPSGASQQIINID